MDRMRFLITILAVATLAAACGTAGAARQTASTPEAPTVAPRATPAGGQAPPSARGSLQLSGGVSGFLSVLAVSCAAEGPGVLVTIKGRVENKLYDVDVRAPGTGGFQLGASAAGVQLSSQTPDDRSVSRWSAGQGQRSSAGSLSISADGGTIDADLQGSGGGVHLRGGWSCAT